MGCLWSKCCYKFFDSKKGEFDPDRHVMIQARDEFEPDDLEMSIKNRTSIENENVAVDLSDGSIDNSPMPNRRPFVKNNSNDTTNSTITLEAAMTPPKPVVESSTSNSFDSHRDLDAHKHNPLIPDRGSTSINSIQSKHEDTNTGKETSSMSQPPPVIRVTPANPRLDSDSSTDDDNMEYECDISDEGHLKVPNEDEDLDEEDDFQAHGVIDLASLRQGIHSTSSLPLEDINEEDSEYSSEPGEEMMNVGPTPHSSAASSEDNEIATDFLDVSKSRKLERTWSFDSNRELVERDLSHSEDEEEKGSLQEKLYEEIVQRFGPDEEFDEKLEKRLRKRSQIQQEEEEELCRKTKQEMDVSKKLKQETDVSRKRIELKQEEEEELLRQYDLVDIPIRPNLSPEQEAFVCLDEAGRKEIQLEIEDYKTRQQHDKFISTKISQSELNNSQTQHGNDTHILNVNKQDMLIGQEKEIITSEKPMKSKHNITAAANLLEHPYTADDSFLKGAVGTSKPVADLPLITETVLKKGAENEVTLQVKPLRGLQKEESEGLRPMSVELIPQNKMLRSSFHNLVIIPINED